MNFDQNCEKNLSFGEILGGKLIEKVAMLISKSKKRRLS